MMFRKPLVPWFWAGGLSVDLLVNDTCRLCFCVSGLACFCHGLQAVEILWTPEDERDTLTTRDMLQDYPLLRPL